MTSSFHARGAVFDTGLLYIVVAMFNLLRLRNGYKVRMLKAFCLGANGSALALEILRMDMYRPDGWGLPVVWFLGIALLFSLEIAFSITTKE